MYIRASVRFQVCAKCASKHKQTQYALYAYRKFVIRIVLVRRRSSMVLAIVLRYEIAAKLGVRVKWYAISGQHRRSSRLDVFDRRPSFLHVESNIRQVYSWRTTWRALSMHRVPRESNIVRCLRLAITRSRAVPISLDDLNSQFSSRVLCTREEEEEVSGIVVIPASLSSPSPLPSLLQPAIEMPLLRKQPFQRLHVSSDFRDDDEVYHCEVTNEIFKDYK